MAGLLVPFPNESFLSFFLLVWNENYKTLFPLLLLLLLLLLLFSFWLRLHSEAKIRTTSNRDAVILRNSLMVDPEVNARKRNCVSFRSSSSFVYMEHFIGYLRCVFAFAFSKTSKRKSKVADFSSLPSPSLSLSPPLFCS